VDSVTPVDLGKPYEGPEEGDAGLAALLRVADRSTVRSVKETILTCLLIWTVRRPTAPKRRVVTVVALSAGGAAAVAHYWHVWAILLHLVH
jgi:hypothetical protein